MLRRIEIDGFKCFQKFEAELRPLTLLTGPNNAGKSSLLQALLLCRFACRSGGEVVPLNGAPGVQLGAVASVLRGEAIRISVQSGGAWSRWSCPGSMGACTATITGS